MKLLVVGINYRPELTGIGKFTGEMAEWLVNRGVEVRVITAPPYYPTWDVLEGYSGKRYKRESLAGVQVLRCPLWVPRKPNGLKRVIHLISFAMSSLLPTLWIALIWRPAWIMVLEPPLMCLPGVLVAAKLTGAKPWLHIQDFEVEAAFDLKILKYAWLRKLAMGTESWLMRRCARVSTISERMLARLDSKNTPTTVRCLFPNWVDTDLISPFEGPNRLREELKISKSKTVLLYSGNMGEKQGLDLVIDAAATLTDDARYLFLMSGEGAARVRLESRACGLQNVRFLPLQPLARLNELLNLADIHLLPQRADAEDLVMPSKLTAMLASGKPVIATARRGTQVAKVVEICGCVVMPGDLLAFKAAIVQLAATDDVRRELGQAGRRYAIQNWAKETVLLKLMSELMRI